jgi:hypothetical protein
MRENTGQKASRDSLFPETVHTHKIKMNDFMFCFLVRLCRIHINSPLGSIEYRRQALEEEPVKGTLMSILT